MKTLVALAAVALCGGVQAQAQTYDIVAVFSRNGRVHKFARR